MCHHIPRSVTRLHCNDIACGSSSKRKCYSSYICNCTLFYYAQDMRKGKFNEGDVSKHNSQGLIN